jgi:hypothetical protein
LETIRLRELDHTRLPQHSYVRPEERETQNS